MANKIDYFIKILFIFLFANLVLNLYLYGTLNSNGNSIGCSFYSVSNCFSNLNGSYSIFGLNVSPLINVFVFVYDGILLILSLFFLSIAIPNAPFLISALIDGMNAILILIMAITLLPFIAGG